VSRSGQRFAAAVAHDINNMLQIVLSFADTLARRLPPADAASEEMRELRAAARRAAELARQLVAFGRREEARPQLIDIGELLTGIEKMLRELVGKNVELVVRRSAALWRVNADPSHIEQVVLNLASNARDAMDGNGTLTLETDNVELEAGPHVLLLVRDSGVGMGEATRARIFEPFFTTKERGRGTGLGLAVAQEIVEGCGGTISVDSIAGKGTTFRVYLPRDPVSGARVAVRTENTRTSFTP
jgi:two-component system cell cycle sensor histidine kinase/response regulator CckA